MPSKHLVPFLPHPKDYVCRQLADGIVLPYIFVLPLFIHIHSHAGLKFHGEFVLIDSDLFNQPQDKLLVLFGESGGLLSII